MFRKFHSIEQFRHIVKQVKDSTCFIGNDDSGNPMFDYNIKLPKIDFVGTVKLHGTNGCVGYKNGEIFVQSRTRLLTLDDDNYRFARWVEDRKDEWLDFFNRLINIKDIPTNMAIYVYGEFAGKKIQKGVGVSNLNKSFFIFDIVTANDEKTIYLDMKTPSLCSSELPKNVYNIYDFRTFTISIDFNNIEEVKNKIYDLTKEVENECPVARKLLPDYDGELIGEGIVWRSLDNKYIFKSKGEKHSKSKVKSVKKLSEDEIAKLNNIEKCVEEIFSHERCNQGLTELFGVDFERNIEIKRIGDYIKWVANDTKKEEYDIVEKYGLSFKDVGKPLSNKVKNYFMEIYKNVDK